MVWNLGCSLFFSKLEVSVQFRDRKNFGGKILALAGWGWCGDLDGLNGGVDCGFKAVQNGGSITGKENIVCVAVFGGIFRNIVSAKIAIGIMNIIRQFDGDEFFTGDTGRFLVLKNPASRKTVSLIRII